MREEFLKFIKDEGLVGKDTPLLLAVSGGVDSMVMLDLFRSSSFNICVAHCNFKLRVPDCDKDEALVKSYCQENDIPFFNVQFDTETESKNRKKGIQETARELRYAWFSQLMDEHNLEVLATAHHKEDSVESMIFNLSRGSGVSGLKGIDAKRDQIIRPLIFAEKTEILNYARQNSVPYRDDASNESLKYKRNYIRHKVIPELKEINSSLVQTLYRQSKIFREGADLINNTIDAELKNELTENDGEEFLPIEYLNKSNYPRLILWRWLEKRGFSSPSMESVLELLDSQKGRRVEVDDYVLSKESDGLLLSKKVSEDFDSHIIEDFGALSRHFSSEIKDAGEINFSNDKSIAYFDLSKIKYPLELRVWKPGDRFVPFGRKTETKVKSFLTHEKLDSVKKRKVRVLISDNRILWLVGVRSSAELAVTDLTSKVLILSTGG